MRETRAIGVAVLVTPVVPGTAMLIGGGGLVDPRVWSIAIPVILVGYVIAFVFTLIPGLCVFLVLRYKNCLRWWTALLAGLPFGLLIAVPFALAVSPASDAIGMLLMFCTLGSLTSFAFWLIWRTLTTVRTLDVPPGWKFFGDRR